jgi:hypothetical protein
MRSQGVIAGILLALTLMAAFFVGCGGGRGVGLDGMRSSTAGVTGVKFKLGDTTTTTVTVQDQNGKPCKGILVQIWGEPPCTLQQNPLKCKENLVKHGKTSEKKGEEGKVTFTLQAKTGYKVCVCGAVCKLSNNRCEWECKGPSQSFASLGKDETQNLGPYELKDCKCP